MPATVAVRHFGNPEKENELLALITAYFKDFQGNWRVTLLGDQQNTIWELNIDSPNGDRVGIKKFYAEDGFRPIMDYVDLIMRDVRRVHAAQQN